MTNQILSLPRFIKVLAAIFLDISLCTLTVWISFYLRTGDFIYLSKNFLGIASISSALAIPIFLFFGLYSVIFRFSGWLTLIPVSRAIFIYGIFFFCLVTVFGFNNVPRIIGIIQPILLLFVIASSRGLIHIWLGKKYFPKSKKNKYNVLIYGAGEAGTRLSSTFWLNQNIKLKGFLDDNKSLHGKTINNQPIYSSNDLDDLIKAKGITNIFLAIPSVSRSRRKEIIESISKKSLKIQTIPNITDIINGQVTISDIRDFEINDLLARDVVKPNYEMLAKNVDSKTILVTGAGGSIGSELCRQMINLKANKILLLENNEFALYKIYSNLNNIIKSNKDNLKIEIVSILGSVQDKDFLNKIFNNFKPNIVYHAAAFKHVTLVENNLIESVKNNVFGTLNLLKASVENKVSDFILISTDKAVRPTSVMGATKRLSELCLQAFYHHNSENLNATKMSMVRFGNALASSGSVIPVFKKQIERGGPITITHKEVTRYFMTIGEAAQLVIQASSLAKGGDVFILDMGKPVKIIDLAKRMITISGLSIKNQDNLKGDIEIIEIGLFPGEKLYEELLLGDNPQSTAHPKIKRAEDPYVIWEQLEKNLKVLDNALRENNTEITLEILEKTVVGYNSTLKN